MATGRQELKVFIYILFGMLSESEPPGGTLAVLVVVVVVVVVVFVAVARLTRRLSGSARKKNRKNEKPAQQCAGEHCLAQG